MTTNNTEEVTIEPSVQAPEVVKDELSRFIVPPDLGTEELQHRSDEAKFLKLLTTDAINAIVVNIDAIREHQPETAAALDNSSFLLSYRTNLTKQITQTTDYVKRSDFLIAASVLWTAMTEDEQTQQKLTILKAVEAYNELRDMEAILLRMSPIAEKLEKGVTVTDDFVSMADRIREMANFIMIGFQKAYGDIKQPSLPGQFLDHRAVPFLVDGWTMDNLYDGILTP